MTRTGGQILVDALIINGVDTIFGVPGESYLAALDALHERRNAVKYVTMRQEGGAALAAAAFSDLTGRPGVCFVTRGPGVCNASIAIHTAWQGSTPLILLIGQIKREHRDRDAFQEIDYRRFLDHTVEWVAEVDDAARLPEYINRAFRTAMSGRPGPVALALPEDMLFDLAEGGLDDAEVDAVAQRAGRAHGAQEVRRGVAQHGQGHGAGSLPRRLPWRSKTITSTSAAPRSTPSAVSRAREATRWGRSR